MALQVDLDCRMDRIVRQFDRTTAGGEYELAPQCVQLVVESIAFKTFLNMSDETISLLPSLDDH